MTAITAPLALLHDIGAVLRANTVANWTAAALLCALPSSRAAGQNTPVVPVTAELRKIVSSGQLKELRWPAFRNLMPGVSVVYEQTGYGPLWIVAGQITPKGQAVLDALLLAADKGLDPEEYDARKLANWAERLKSAGGTQERELAALDAAITVELMRYASALHQGRVDPRQVHFAIRPKDRLDPGKFVRDYLQSARSLPELLAEIEPPFRGYRRTLAALVQYQELASREPAQMPLRPRLPLKKGQSYGDMQHLVARLELLGDLQGSPATAGPSGIYDGAAFEAMQRFQRRHGLPATGTVDAATWRAFTMPLSRRVEQLQLTLERWRWLPSAVMPAVVVNIPEFELRAYDENRELALRMHVIVGKSYRHKTPVFEDKLEFVIVRPWWNVPLSIQREEMVPELRAHPDYLQKNHLQAFDRANRPVAAPPQQLLEQLASGELRLRQQPGPDNSLGLLKFDFPNNYSVYMHGTPARQLFSQSRRDFSHGCIRLEDPESLAAWVLQHDPAWNRETITAAMTGDRTIRIPVVPPVTVLVVYGTAFVEENGEARFYSDLYGYDRELRQALALSHP